MKGDSCDVVEGFVDSLVVEGFDVGKDVGEFVAGDPDLVGGQAIEHKGVIGVGAVGDADLLRCDGARRHGTLFLFGAETLVRICEAMRFAWKRDLVLALTSSCGAKACVGRGGSEELADFSCQKRGDRKVENAGGR